jgi:hypothetical protein
LHWSDQGNLANSGPGQQCMADVNSLTFWTQVATAYANDSHVIFEMYNEPFVTDWGVWLNGGSSCGYTCVGMQQIYNAIRETGANNVVIAGGINYAFDLSGVAANALTGYNIMYATHPYDYSGKQPADWDTAFGYLTPTYPVIATEFGQYCSNDGYVSALLSYCQTKGIHWTAWAWYVNGCGFPSIVADWNGTPLSPVGPLVLAALGGNFTGTGSASSSSGTSSGSNTGSGSTGGTPAAGDLIVYTDSLQNGWISYGWASDLTYSATTYVHSGSDSISFTPTNNNAVYVHSPSDFDPNSYASLNFWVNGGTSASQSLQVYFYDSNTNAMNTKLSLPQSLQQGIWSLEVIPISSFDIPIGTMVSGFAIQEASSNTLPAVYIDDIYFAAPSSSATSSGSATGSTATSAAATGSTATSAAATGSTAATTAPAPTSKGAGSSSSSTTGPDHEVGLATNTRACVVISMIMIIMTVCVLG